MPIEHLREFVKTTPAARLKWLEGTQEFVKKAVDPKKLEHWQKIKQKGH